MCLAKGSVIENVSIGKMNMKKGFNQVNMFLHKHRLQQHTPRIKNVNLHITFWRCPRRLHNVLLYRPRIVGGRHFAIFEFRSNIT